MRMNEALGSHVNMVEGISYEEHLAHDFLEVIGFEILLRSALVLVQKLTASTY